jgi:hypothetical protein
MRVNNRRKRQSRMNKIAVAAKAAKRARAKQHIEDEQALLSSFEHLRESWAGA